MKHEKRLRAFFVCSRCGAYVILIGIMDSDFTSYKGLSSEQAAHLLAEHGKNQIAEENNRSAFELFLRALNNPLVYILLAASGLSIFFGEYISAGIIIVMVLLSTVLDFYNTYRAERAVKELQERVKLTVTVIRDGKQKSVELAYVVPGDHVVLVPGNLVPADGSVIEAEDFFLNEASLTGESFPAEKHQNDLVFMGTSVVTGKALMRVDKTGKETKFSAIAQTLAHAQGQTEFDRGVRSFSMLIVRVIMVLVVFIFAVNALTKHSLFESFLFALALAVGLTPELLPMIITLNLSHGSLAMGKRGIIVKKLSAIQDFGSMDILCTDKTGTLTEDKISLIKCVDCVGEESHEVFTFAYINSIFHTAIKSPLDSAIQERGGVDRRTWSKQDEIPFDFQRRRDSIIAKQKDGLFIITKGAPEEILRACVRWGSMDNAQTIDDNARDKILKEYESLSADGFRTLGIAVKALEEPQQSYRVEDEHDLVFLGFAAFLDPPKKTVAEALRLMRSYGVTIKVLTGDNELVTQKIAQQIGLEVNGVVHGPDIAVMDEQALGKAVEQATLFTRVLPDQKMRIIKALQQNQHVVGYLGDGINDAPSLKAADVGISVDNAVDVAKDTADFILLKKNLHDLIQGVEEGRRTLENTLKYMMMALSSNFGNMLSMAGASLFLPFLPMLPTQILLNNFLYDASQFTIAVDTVDPEAVTRPRKWDIGFIKKYMLIFGVVSSVFDYITFWVLLSIFNAHESVFQTGWFITSFISQIAVVYIIRTRGLLFEKSKPHPALVVSTLTAIVVGVALAQTVVGSVLFGFTPLPLALLGATILITAWYLLVAEITKLIVFRRLRFT